MSTIEDIDELHPRTFDGTDNSSAHAAGPAAAGGGGVRGGIIDILTTMRAKVNEVLPHLTTNVIADPGDAGAIPVTRSGVCALTSAGAETRTLAIPTFLGQRLTLVCDTYVGDIVVATSTAVNVANNNRLTFGAVSEALELVAVSVAGALVWQIGWNDGVGLTTV